MAWARPRRTADDGGQSAAKIRPKGMAAKRAPQVALERRSEGRSLQAQAPRSTGSTESSASQEKSPQQAGKDATTEALFGQNPFHGVECLSGAAASVEVVEARASLTPLAWQEEDTLLEEKSLSPIGATSSPKAFQSPVSPPTLACSHIYRQSPLTEPREGSAVKQIADIVADAEAQILRRMEGWTSDGMVNQLATGTVSDLRLSSAIAGDCMKLKGTVEELKTKMAHLAEENLRLRNELFKRDDGNRTPRTPDTQTAMLQMMQQQLQQQQQLIQLLGSSQASLAAVAGVVTTPRGTQAAPAMLPATAAAPAAPAVVVRPPETVQVRPVVVSRCATPRGPLVHGDGQVLRSLPRASSVPAPQRGAVAGQAGPYMTQVPVPAQRAGSVTALQRPRQAAPKSLNAWVRETQANGLSRPAPWTFRQSVPVTQSQDHAPWARPSLPFRSFESLGAARTTL